MKPPCPRAQWTKLLWFKGMIPKQDFMCWLVMLNRLSTRDKQVNHNPLLEATCLFCSSAESKDHIFFTCDLLLEFAWKLFLRLVRMEKSL